MMDRWREFEHDRESPEEKPPSWMMLSPEDPRICRDCRMRVERKRHEKQLIIKLRNQNVLLKEKLRLLIDEKSKTMREYFGAKNQVKQTKTKIETKEPKDIESEENEVVEEEERDY